MIVYPLDRLYEEMAYIAHHFHWPYDQIMQMDHYERQRWVDQIVTINTEFNDAATKMTGDLMARTDPDYQPIYQTAGEHTGKLFADLHIPGPELIANLIMEAVLSETPKLLYSAGPINDEFLGNRSELDDEGFHRFMMDKFGLKDLKV